MEIFLHGLGYILAVVYGVILYQFTMYMQKELSEATKEEIMALKVMEVILVITVYFFIVFEVVFR